MRAGRNGSRTSAKPRYQKRWEEEVKRRIRVLRATWKPTKEVFHEGYTKHRLLPDLTGSYVKVGDRIYVGMHGTPGFVAGFINHTSYCLILWDDGVSWSPWEAYELSLARDWREPCKCGSIACTAEWRRFRKNPNYRPRGLAFHGIVSVRID